MKKKHIKPRLALNLETIKQLDDLRAVAGGRGEDESIPRSGCLSCVTITRN